MKKKDFYNSTAWRWFSRYIMLSNAKYVNGEYKLNCFTCDRAMTIPNRNAQAGHYVKVFTSGAGSNLATAFEEKNIHPQCYDCNHNQRGAEVVMAFKIDQKYGKGVAQGLKDRAKVFKKLDRVDLKEIGKTYREKFKELAKVKGDPWK